MKHVPMNDEQAIFCVGNARVNTVVVYLHTQYVNLQGVDVKCVRLFLRILNLTESFISQQDKYYNFI